MKIRWTTFEEAAVEYTALTGEIPEASLMFGLYHRYRNEWKHFNGFRDWMNNHYEEVA